MTEWMEGALNGAHHWHTYEGGAMCALTTSEKDCRSKGDKRLKVKCSSCHMIVHEECREDLSVRCRTTFRDASFKKEQWTPHHWVLQRKGFGTRCGGCNKTLTKSSGWSTGRNSKSFIAVSCSWCKEIYHTSCFTLSLIEDHCTLGEFEQIIVPPNWIVYTSKNNKKPDKRKISYSTRPSSCSSKRGNHRKRQDHEKEECRRPFHIKVGSSNSTKTPLLVFVNPKSGGNQGASLIHAFQWFLNPRQVFDMMDGGPTLGLQLYQNVPNLRILCCGGDGTVGWVLSEIDKLNFINLPPCAILPLGTGNDLARVLNWGAAYAGEPIDKILSQVSDAAVHCLDRWEIAVENIDSSQLTPTSPHSASVDEADSQNSKEDEALEQPVTKLPVNIFNNYFGIGLDAHIQYQFHTGREAKPEKFNSRAYNKFVYFKGGLYDTFEQRYKNLSKFVELICDGEDYTEKIKEQKIHCIVFLNIKSYSGGVNPWGTARGAARPAAMDDGFIEVVGLFSAPTMAALQVGIPGFRICQCRKAVVKARKAVHCQVDGEPCYIAPSTFRISRRNQARMLMRWKSRESKSFNSISTGESSVCSVGPPSCTEDAAPVKVALHKVTAHDFQANYGSLEKLQKVAHPLTIVMVQPSSTLDSMRPTVERWVRDQSSNSPGLSGLLSDNWVFLHRANDRLYPISSDMEAQLSVLEMVPTGIFILDTRISNNADPVESSPTLRLSVELEVNTVLTPETPSSADNADPISRETAPGGQDNTIPVVKEPSISQNYVDSQAAP